MSHGKTEKPFNGVELEYEFDEPPRKVWRAITIPEFRERWLPKEALAEAEATCVTPEREVSFRMRDRESPFLESTVTFRLAPNAAGGTSLRIIHEVTDARLKRMVMTAANNNSVPVMRAA
ncbi:Uncharacterized conserved protein YndB, AHSA1/START domain [Enhydrobacter aerosaccus]|uniref:Uncharacterized conserved protein YndB, AHSA1/START domain n=1 Tax=Enhydrobacter aerosaccus TaxID=225324 RepID=A0A1T4NE72_9HYPH|nr:SRPBCC domain-containing protein [Enhydrobacter aerosaccus]SJZ77534.1 Uncharacterized conserved protein YndB, AHSA1/START domain [Enhydrobacter aerosaccus]